MRKPLALLFLLSLLIAPLGAMYRVKKAQAGDSIGYSPLRSDVSSYHAAATTAESTTFSTTAGPVHGIPTSGNPHVMVYSSFSVASATCVFSCTLWHKKSDGTWQFLGTSAANATATGAGSGVVDKDGRFPNLANLDFDTRGADYVDIRCAAPSSGNVTTMAWCYGLVSK